jgi:hypothetical protein
VARAAASSAVRLAFIMCVAETLSMTGFAAYTTLLPQLQREWGLSNSQAGSIGGISTPVTCSRCRYDK